MNEVTMTWSVTGRELLELWLLGIQKAHTRPYDRDVTFWDLFPALVWSRDWLPPTLRFIGEDPQPWAALPQLGDDLVLDLSDDDTQKYVLYGLLLVHYYPLTVEMGLDPWSIETCFREARWSREDDQWMIRSGEQVCRLHRVLAMKLTDEADPIRALVEAVRYILDWSRASAAAA